MPKMLCKEVILDFLADYLDGALSLDVIADLEGHLRDCPPCVAYLNTYRKTRELTGRGTHVDMPAEMKSRLRQFLLDRLEKGRPGG